VNDTDSSSSASIFNPQAEEVNLIQNEKLKLLTNNTQEESEEDDIGSIGEESSLQESERTEESSQFTNYLSDPEEKR
jgi:hypothetical protein